MKQQNLSVRRVMKVEKQLINDLFCEINKLWYVNNHNKQNTMWTQHPQPPFQSPKFYIIADVLFFIFSVLYITIDTLNIDNPVKYVKPLPVWIMMIQLWSLRSVKSQINTIIWALFCGSLGDIFLLFDKQSSIFFAVGALAFLVGHLIYVASLVNLARDTTQNKISMREVLRLWPLFICIWLVLLTFSFWSISTLVKSLKPEQDYYIYVLTVYGSCLVLLTMGGFFFFFSTSHVKSKTILQTGLLYMLGALTFYASDNLLAHSKFNSTFTDPNSINKWQPIFSSLIMITYYAAQFMLAKGAFLSAVYYTEEADGQINRIQNEGIV